MSTRDGIRGGGLRRAVAAVAVVLVVPVAFAEKVRIEVVSFPKHPIETIELLVAPDKTIGVTLQSHALSDPLMVPRMPVWKFGTSEPGADGQLRFRTLAEVKPGSARRQLLVFLRRGKGPKREHKIIPLDAGRTGFGEGKMFVMNLARTRVGGSIGGKTFLLEPGRHVVVEPEEDRGEGLCYALLRYRKEDEWRPFLSTNWPMLTDARGLVFAYEDPRSKRVRIHTIVDSLYEVEAAGE